MHKKFFFIIFFFNIISFCYSQNDNSYILKGKFSKAYLPSVGCGFEAYAYVVEFEIINFSYADYKKKFISIIVPCPELYGDNFFVKGKIYEIKLKEKNSADFDYIIFDEKNLKKNKINKDFWANSIDKIN